MWWWICLLTPCFSLPHHKSFIGDLSYSSNCFNISQFAWEYLFSLFTHLLWSFYVILHWCMTHNKMTTTSPKSSTVSSLVVNRLTICVHYDHYGSGETPEKQAEPWWRASIWRSHRKVVMKQCSYHNNIIDIQNRLPYSKVVYPAIIVLFSCLMEVNHGVRTGPDYPFR